MTQPNLPVSQEDRDAAADLALAMQMDATAYIVRKGKGDADMKPLTQAFARHRIQADAAGYRRAVEEAAGVAETFPPEILHFYERPGSPPGNQMRPTTRSDIAAAILALNKDQSDAG